MLDKEILLKRLETSIDFVEDGINFNVGEFVLGKVNSNRIFVNGYLDYIYINSIYSLSKLIVQQELLNIKDDFFDLVNQSEVFSKFIANKEIDFYLVFDTGNAGINICEEINGKYKLFNESHFKNDL